MFLIFENGGKQYKVKKGDVLKLESFDCKKDDIVKLENVTLFCNENNEIAIGSPFIQDAYVKVKILDIVKDQKVIIFKKKRRHNYRRKIGHRQQISVIKITDIQFLSKSNKDLSKKSNESKDLKTKSKTE